MRGGNFRGGPPQRRGPPQQQARPQGQQRPPSATWGVQRLQGKDYFTVARRVYDFRQTHSADDGWGIETEFHADEKLWVCKASVVNPSGRTVATGFAASPKQGGRSAEKTNPMECAETSAIGRALAAFGYVSNGSYASYNEVRQAQARRQEQEPKP